MNHLKKLLLTLVLLGTAATLQAEIAVIVHPSVTTSASADDVRRLFLGKAKSLPDGVKLTPLNQNKGTPAREAFNDKVLKKSESQLKSYWSKLIFTGKGQPPKDSGTDDDIVKAVSSDPGVIGYIDKSKANDKVRILISF